MEKRWGGREREKKKGKSSWKGTGKDTLSHIIGEKSCIKGGEAEGKVGEGASSINWWGSEAVLTCAGASR